METYMKVNGLMIKLMDLVDIIIVMEQHMKESGRMINNMVMEKNNGQMVQNIRVYMKMERNMVKVYYNLWMDHFIMENSIIMIYMEKVIYSSNIYKVDMYGQIKENMKDNGIIIKCMVLELLNGQMEKYMMESN